jgi:hypothetical protein
MNQNPKHKRTKRQHLITRWYLEKFADKGKVWVVDFHSDCPPYKTNTINTMCVSDFYTVSTETNKQDDTLERTFSDIEAEVKPIVDRLLTQMAIPSGRDQEKLAGFLACLYLRGPRFRQMYLELYESYHKLRQTLQFSKDAIFERFFQDYLKKHPETTLTKEMSRELLDKTVVEGYMNRESYIMAFLRELPIVETLFGKMSLNLLWADPSKSPRFVTGDFPFVFQDTLNMKYGMPVNGGLLNKYARIFVPISSLACLMLDHRGRNEVYAISSKEFIPEINSQLALEVSRYIISSSKNIYWFKRNRIHCSGDELHDEFYPMKLEQPIMVMDSEYCKQALPARRSWNKLKGDKPPEDMRGKHD